MEIKDIIADLERVSRHFPYAAINEAIRQKDQVIPELLALIDDPARLFTTCQQQPDYLGHMYAFFLLAQFRATEAYAPLLRIYEHPRHQVDLLGWEFSTGDLPRIVASVYNGDLAPLQQMIERRDVDEFVREALLKTLLILVAYHTLPREDLVAYCAALLRGKLERTPSEVWTGLVLTCTELAARELLGDIATAYADGLVDPNAIALEDVEAGMRQGWEGNLARILGELEYGLVEDAAGEMEDWAYFHEDPRTPPNVEKLPRIPFPGMPRPPPQPRPREPPKTGRNDPCPCGSGKKYKACCGKKTAHQKSS